VTSALEPLAAALAERYRLEREIGRGGMATVYLAEDCKHHRKVALKILRPEVAASLGVERFLREIEIASHLAHPHILPVHDSGEAAGFLYYVMPYVEGETLRDRLAREAQLPIEDALQITREVADALGYAHSLGVVHRDIKPENVLFEAGHAVLSDFGIARAISAASGEHVTETGLSVGTPSYMSPEQATGDRAVDGRSDIYSLGCMLYEMLVGEPPYTGCTAQLVMAKQLTDPVPAVRRVRETVPAGVERALTKALAKVPADRFVTASAFSEALAKPAPVAAGPRSVAVLPFLNFSADPENEHFADGMTEDVIAQLSKIGSLKVISRTSVMLFKKREQSLQEIATKLRVATLLEGSIRRAGNRVRIVAQLIDAETDQHLWAETYDRDLTDIFAIQGDVASHIAAALKAELSPGEESRLRKKPTGNLEAYDLFLRGRHCLLRYTSEGIRQGLEYLDQAIAKDPGYALAYTQLAVAYVAMAMGYGAGTVRAQEAYPKAKEAAEMALRLDEELGEAHGSLAFVKLYFEFDWAGAEREFQRAWELNPGTGTMGEMLRDMHGLMLSALERYDEAIAMLARAQELDPLSAVHSSELATTLVRAGRYDEAIREAERLIELQPDFPMAHSSLGWAYVKQGRSDDGLAELMKAVSLSPGNTMLLAQLGQAYGMVGNTLEARRVLRQLEALSRERYVSPYHLAYVHTGLGEQEEAIDCLERAYEERSGGIYGVKGSFLFTTLRSHARFAALMRKMNLE
jgi:serine/threonine protein kinase/Tfp pilus assembly protein PilF